MPESVGGEYCLFGDRLWDDHIAVLLIHELGHLIRKPQKGICIILTPMVALVQQVISGCWLSSSWGLATVLNFWLLVVQHMGLGNSLDSFNLVVNNGASAGQVIFHTHIHIIPRKVHDCLWPSESLRRRRLKLDQDVFKLVDSVREQLSVSNNTKNGLTGN
uniref:HIT domain-containing protein n=1 Tax=Quercus lobata TaxID=97700 RepID=A0A7N2MLL4_QUELO